MNMDEIQKLRAELHRTQALVCRYRLEADTCSLTGLLNRRGFRRVLNPTALGGWYIVADLDAFKVAQDRPGCGHAYGDATLQEFARFLQANTRGIPRSEDRRKSDVLAARTGGDEFTVWTPSYEGAKRIAKVIRTWKSSDGAVEASAGVGSILALADSACYADKQARRTARTAR